jgi:DNA polymerase elongation subunit (family B)
MGFDVLHLYIDSIFVCRRDASQEDFQALVEEIEKETSLPMDHENTYSWFAFLSSRENQNVSVSNKFFGVAENGKHKIRGVASRRGDTCAFVADIQREIIQILAKEKDVTKLAGLLPEALEMVQAKLSSLKNKEIPAEELVITQTLSRDLEGYSVLSPVAVAARQLYAHRKTIGMGQRVRFIHTSPGSSVYAWGLPYPIDPRVINVGKYKELVLRASHEVLEPMGVTEVMLRNWLFHNASYITPAELVNLSKDKNKLSLPLFAEVDNLRVDKF